MDRSKRNENMTVGVSCLKERERERNRSLPIGDNRRMLQVVAATHVSDVDSMVWKTTNTQKPPLP